MSDSSSEQGPRPKGVERGPTNFKTYRKNKPLDNPPWLTDRVEELSDDDRTMVSETRSSLYEESLKPSGSRGERRRYDNHPDEAAMRRPIPRPRSAATAASLPASDEEDVVKKKPRYRDRYPPQPISVRGEPVHCPFEFLEVFMGDIRICVTFIVIYLYLTGWVIYTVWHTFTYRDRMMTVYMIPEWDGEGLPYATTSIPGGIPTILVGVDG
ncbi:hypothetical protein ABW19_dt0201946 [Dactylella cylindrospora]|nr:hypothetical protein ABW19_dt0201946 [Dactylella cylindrospora]